MAGSVRRWRKYGHDRTYVDDADGRQLGYRDELTGDLVPEPRVPVEALARALGIPAPARSHDDDPPDDVPPDVPPDEDLVANPPGLSALRAADAVRDEEIRQWRERTAAEHRAALIRYDDARMVHARSARRYEGRVARYRRHRFGRLLVALGLAGRPPVPPVPPAPPPSAPATTVADRSWRVGAAGEQAMAEMLAGLGAGWSCLHSVPVGNRGSDLDHVVVGPCGVVVVNTKVHPGRDVWSGGSTVTVDGHRTQYVRNAGLERRRAAAAAQRAGLHDVPVLAVVAVLGAARVRAGRTPPPAGVLVLPAGSLVAVLRSLPRTLRDDEVRALFAVLRRASSWA